MCLSSADDGSATDWHQQHLPMLAMGGAALVMTEATHVERRGRITHGCLGLYSVALARADPRWGWRAADTLGVAVDCPPQYLRAKGVLKAPTDSGAANR